MQTVYTTQYQIGKQPNQRMGRSLNTHFSKEDINGKQAHENMFNITDY